MAGLAASRPRVERVSMARGRSPRYAGRATGEIRDEVRNRIGRWRLGMLAAGRCRSGRSPGDDNRASGRSCRCTGTAGSGPSDCATGHSPGPADQCTAQCRPPWASSELPRSGTASRAHRLRPQRHLGTPIAAASRHRPAVAPTWPSWRPLGLSWRVSWPRGGVCRIRTK